MILFENTVVPSAEQWLAVISGARNPMNSWNKSDSDICMCNGVPNFTMGSADFELLLRLAKSGPDHRKYMRMLNVIVDIEAPLYFLKELDTYKIGSTCNSCSTMHKIHAVPFCEGDFSNEFLLDEYMDENGYIDPESGEELFPDEWLSLTIGLLNHYREKYLATKDKKYWWQLIQMLPSSYNQTRTYSFSYELLRNIYHARKGHKLNEWHRFREWIENLPNSEFITEK